MISEDRVSHLAHKVIDAVWRADVADLADETRALAMVKNSITAYFSVAEDIDAAVRKKLATMAKMPGSREYEVLYQKYLQEETAKRKW
jgi:hypothetical protein